MKMIVGLGNPGVRYARTRHNVGFDTVETLAAQLGWAWDTRRSQSVIASGTVMRVIQPPKPQRPPKISPPVEDGAAVAVEAPAVIEPAPEPPEPIMQPEKMLLVKPQTYMNDSGKAVADLVRFYKLTLSDLLVICDDLDSPLGRLRLRERGAAGGQHGMESIIRWLGTSEFARLKIGIGRPLHGRGENLDFLLSAPRGDERIALDEAIARAADAALCWATLGAQTAMNRYNG